MRKRRPRRHRAAGSQPAGRPARTATSPGPDRVSGPDAEASQAPTSGLAVSARLLLRLCGGEPWGCSFSPQTGEDWGSAKRQAVRGSWEAGRRRACWLLMLRQGLRCVMEGIQADGPQKGRESVTAVLSVSPKTELAWGTGTAWLGGLIPAGFISVTG